MNFANLINLPYETQIFAVFAILVLAVFIFGLPREVFMIYAGYAFGILIGGAVNLLGLLGGCIIGYALGSIGKYQPKNLKIRNFLGNNGSTSLFFVRIIPFSPHDTISMISGYLRLKPKGYFLPSGIAFTPYAFFWSYMGSKAGNVFKKLTGISIENMIWSLILFCILITGIGIVTNIKRFRFLYRRTMGS